MAEPSLLCVSCARPPPPHRRTWGRCTVCVARNLPSTYYCGEECMNAHWQNGHKEWHKAQKESAKAICEGGQPERNRLIAEAQARRAEVTGSEYDKRFAAALALNAKVDHNAAAKAWRKIIKEWPDEPEAYHNLANVMSRSCRDMEAVPIYLKAMELHEDGTKLWANAAASAFDLLKTPACDEVPKPEWWNDEALKALSARLVAVAPEEPHPCTMRARVLTGGALSKAPWNAAPRTAAEIKEAATWYRRVAMLLTRRPSERLMYEGAASQCDEYADPLLAKEAAEAAKARAAAEAEAAQALKVAEAEAAAARAAAEAEAAEAMKVAEAKAKAAAEELLAEEEKEKQQASTKAGKAKSKGKKGKGKR